MQVGLILNLKDFQLILWSVGFAFFPCQLEYNKIWLLSEHKSSEMVFFFPSSCIAGFCAGVQPSYQLQPLLPVF